MMKTKTDRGLLYVEFKHINPNGSKFTVAPEDAGTYCLIKREHHNGEIITQAKSMLHKNDYHSFNKVKGRKIAFKRALAKLHLKYEDRKKMWENFFRHTKMN